MEILIKRLNEQAKLPAYGEAVGPGIELYATEAVTVAPGATVCVATGVAIAMPVGYVGVVWNRNSLVIGEPLRLTTSVIDSGCRDEIKVEMTNTSDGEVMIAVGEVVAQILVQAVSHAHLIEAEDLSGFGATDE